MNDPSSTRVYFDTHEQLASWNDELEFLEYILCEVIDPDEFSERGFQCHQAADLPALVSMLRKASRTPDGKLAIFMNDDERKNFRQLMNTTREIRNIVAHHQVPDEEHLNDLRFAKEQLCSMIEALIIRTASKLGINQIGWVPYHSASYCGPETDSLPNVTVYLNEGPLLSFRRCILETRSNHQYYVYSRQNIHTAEYNRQRNVEATERSLKRKEERRKRHIVKLSHDQTAKLRKLQDRYIHLYQCRCKQLEKVKSNMQKEREVFKHQKERIFQGGVVQPDLDQMLSPLLLFLAVSSPLWLIGLSLYALLCRVRAYLMHQKGSK